jgi:hypothetical protein
MRTRVAVVVCEPIHAGHHTAGASNQRIQPFKRV